MNLLLLPFLFLGSSLAQRTVKGRLRSHLPNQREVTRVSHGLDNRVLLKQSMKVLAEKDPQPMAHPIPVSIDPRKDGEWWLESEYRHWTIAIESPGALAIGLLFDRFRIPPRGELYLGSSLQAFTGALNNREGGSFATWPVGGDLLQLEYIEPISEQQSLELLISQVNHVFLNPKSESYGASGYCNLDLACFNDTETISSDLVVVLICQLILVETRTMLNNAREDGRQLLLTAGHCIPSRPEQVLVGFGYEHARCSEVDGGEPALRTVQGGRLLASWGMTDFGLLEIIEPIPKWWGVRLAGWDRRTQPVPRNVLCIHHPQGDVKKVSYRLGECKPAKWSEPKGQWHWEVPSWTEGITERGSSGSALFEAERGLVVGQLHGGQSSCANPTGWDRFGALAYSWRHGRGLAEQLAPHLDPDYTEVEVLLGRDL